MTVVTDEPGFTAQILAGNQLDGKFKDVSEEQIDRRRTTIERRHARTSPSATTSSGSRDLDGPRTLNEVRASVNQ